jgi:hypothetical protein
MDQRRWHELRPTLLCAPHAPQGAAQPTLRRAGGLSPFDPECDDLTRVERNAPAVFIDNRFFSLGFTSTQQQICEQLNPTTNDPNTGLMPFPPFLTGCPQ